MAYFANNRTHAVFQLSQPFFNGMPHHPNHPPFMHVLTRLHGDGSGNYLNGSEAVGDSISMGTHVGTHVDGVFHVSHEGRLFGGIDVHAKGVQQYSDGIQVPDCENLRPIIGRGVLLDLPRLLHTERIPSNYKITKDIIIEGLSEEGTDIREGDILLIRTGWDLLWNQPGMFLSKERPGPILETAQWLRETGIAATGSDTASYEYSPHHMEVHAELLVRGGINIMECLNLRELSANKLYEFQFVGIPLSLQGATASPINPVAIVPEMGWHSV